MGITGLIPFLEKSSCKTHIKEMKGTTVAIDTYCWLHKGAFACADRLGRGEPTDVHIQYCLKYVRMLLSYDIKPILVFDGRHLPAKALTEKKRRDNRKAAKERAVDLLRRGRKTEALSYFRRCVDITHKMALQLIQECHKINVDCIVAPYEADAQLAYLNRQHLADYVITEDSDLVLFGCTKILFKLDLSGCCLLVDASQLHLSMGCHIEKFTFDKFLHMCILSGCDYLESLPGIGLAKACKFILKTEDNDIRRALGKIPMYLNMRQLTVSEEYKDSFLKAVATFKHMYVYDPIHRQMTRLTSLEDAKTDTNWCSNAGSLIDESTAFQLALGNVDPFTLKPLDQWNPDYVPGVQTRKMNQTKQISIAKHKSIWAKDFKHMKQVKISSIYGGKMTSSTVRLMPKIPLNESVEIHEESINDLLDMYGKEPANKRQKTEYEPQINSNNLTETIEDTNILPQTQKRNPFIKTRTITDSPTKITKENSSLLKNISPKKSNNSPKSHITQQRKTCQLNGINNEQPIVSQFSIKNLMKLQAFNNVPDKPAPQIDEKMAQKMIDIEAVMEANKLEHSLIYLAQELCNESLANKTETIRPNLQQFYSVPKKCLSTNLNENETSQQEEIIPQKSDHFSDKLLERNVPKMMLKRGCKRLTLPKLKTTTTTQSSLGMFGFKKKPQLT